MIMFCNNYLQLVHFEIDFFSPYYTMLKIDSEEIHNWNKMDTG